MTKSDTHKNPPAVPDMDIPAGDSPPKPKWPLILAAVAWGGWFVFMLAMLIVRLCESPVG
ncbi:MAG: hypothetical protein JXA69_20730 [Phycisphaerae bacterium]|nr:hypothetical protein [Phycisphaerae bacterium]